MARPDYARSASRDTCDPTPVWNSCDTPPILARNPPRKMALNFLKAVCVLIFLTSSLTTTVFLWPSVIPKYKAVCSYHFLEHTTNLFVKICGDDFAICAMTCENYRTIDPLGMKDFLEKCLLHKRVCMDDAIVNSLTPRCYHNVTFSGLSLCINRVPTYVSTASFLDTQMTGYGVVRLHDLLVDFVKPVLAM
jgi:hypothetical protein